MVRPEARPARIARRAIARCAQATMLQVGRVGVPWQRLRGLPMLRYAYDIHTTVLVYPYLAHASRMALEQARVAKERSLYMASMLLDAFCLEAYLNYLGLTIVDVQCRLWSGCRGHAPGRPIASHRLMRVDRALTGPAGRAAAAMTSLGTGRATLAIAPELHRVCTGIAPNVCQACISGEGPGNHLVPLVTPSLCTCLAERSS